MPIAPVVALLAMASQGPEPLHPVPSLNQLAWHELEYYAFVHFGPNTFSGLEWGHGTEDPKSFNPQQLDCRQWVHAFKEAGMKGVIITAKHHDGFCLWPSKLSTHTVAQSAWRDGKGDVLRELAEACREAGLKMGVYLSPWDRNHPQYGTDGYNDVFAGMLEEVLGHYGPLFEVWWDGANGEGPNGKRQAYDWQRFRRTVRRFQPKAVIFSDADDLRWVGNEQGYASETSWYTLNKEGLLPGTPRYAELGEGHERGTDWVPPECHVSIRPAWFWRASEDDQVKPVDQLMDIWYGSVGRGASLLLNVPPNEQGLISDADVRRLQEFAEARRREFERIERFKSATDDGAMSAHPASHAIDGRPETFWAAPEHARRAELRLGFAQEREVNLVSLGEPIALGQRVAGFRLYAWIGDQWKLLADGTTIGRKRLVRFKTVKTAAIRLSITRSLASPLISEAVATKTPEDPE